jgi:hypothetical protein
VRIGNAEVALAFLLNLLDGMENLDESVGLWGNGFSLNHVHDQG